MHTEQIAPLSHLPLTLVAALTLPRLWPTQALDVPPTQALDVLPASVTIVSVCASSLVLTVAIMAAGEADQGYISGLYIRAMHQGYIYII